MAMLPRSIFATPGVRAMGQEGIVPAGYGDKRIHGWQIALVARSAETVGIRPPCFGFVTVNLRKKGGGMPARDACFVVSVVHLPDRQDVVALVFYFLAETRPPSVLQARLHSQGRQACACSRSPHLCTHSPADRARVLVVAVDGRLQRDGR